MGVLLFKYETSFPWKLIESQGNDPTSKNPGGEFFFFSFCIANVAVTAIEIIAVMYNRRAKSTVCKLFQI